MIQERRTINSQFDNQLEEFNSYSDYLSVPEKGAIIYSNGRAFYGNGESWMQLANNSDIPVLEHGYSVYTDTTRISLATSQNLSVSENRIFNDAGSVDGELGGYDEASNAFILKDRIIYNISISFNARVSANNQHAQVFLGGGGLAWNGLSTIITFPKGNNVEHEFYLTFQVIGDGTTESTGIIPYIFPSHAGQLWNAKFTIQKAF